MISQFDILSDKDGNLYIVVSNNLVNSNSNILWAMVVKQEKWKFETDIILPSKNKGVKGIIDTTLITYLDIESETYSMIDQAQPRVYKPIIEAIEAHTEVL